jgi:HTH-type transcriptional repressor of NAD biosynthesis genes
MSTVGFFGGKFLVLHKGHVNAMIKASTMVDELHIIVVYDEEYERDFYFMNSKIKPIPYHQRLRWWHEITKDMKHVFVHTVEEKQTGTFEDWEREAIKIKQVIGKQIDMIFSSESRYTKYFNLLYPEAEHIVLDEPRSFYPISSTQIRNEGVIKHWDMLPEIVKPYFAKSVVVIGTESTGKSTLVRNLASVYSTKYVEEYGRTFYENIGAEIAIEEDFPRIAFEHKYHEQQGRKQANKVFFIDTEAVVTQYYSILYCGVAQPVLDEIIKLEKYDLWLFLEPDVEWVADGMRTLGEESIRKKNNEFLKDMLNKYEITYSTISGSYSERLNKAINLIEELLQ